ncbi:MAG: M56 family metallopeptidase [Planctomycetota bacterium]
MNLVEMLLANAVWAAPLALLAWVVGSRTRSPALAHAVWLVVLLKLVTPPIFEVPLPGLAPESAAPVAVASAPRETDDLADLDPAVAAFVRFSEREELAAPAPAPVAVPAAPATAETSPAVWAGRAALALWAIGSIAVAGLAWRRARAFRRLLRCGEAPPRELARRAHRLARRLGLARAPRIVVVPAQVSPMIWGLGRGTTLVLPRDLGRMLSRRELETLLLHELAHVLRRDHWVRFVEIAAVVLYWWNPVLWLCRRELRRCEEECCDAWVVTTLPEEGRSYASALITCIDYVAGVPRPVPPTASALGAAGLMKRRVEMILSARRRARLDGRARLALALAALLALPVLPVLAQDEKPEPKTYTFEEARAVALAESVSLPDEAEWARLAAAPQDDELAEVVATLKKVIAELSKAEPSPRIEKQIDRLRRAVKRLEARRRAPARDPRAEAERRDVARARMAEVEMRRREIDEHRLALKRELEDRRRALMEQGRDLDRARMELDKQRMELDREAQNMNDVVSTQLADLERARLELTNELEDRRRDIERERRRRAELEDVEEVDEVEPEEFEEVEPGVIEEVEEVERPQPRGRNGAVRGSNRREADRAREDRRRNRDDLRQAERKLQESQREEIERRRVIERDRAAELRAREEANRAEAAAGADADAARIRAQREKLEAELRSLREHQRELQERARLIEAEAAARRRAEADVNRSRAEVERLDRLAAERAARREAGRSARWKPADETPDAKTPKPDSPKPVAPRSKRSSRRIGGQGQGVDAPRPPAGPGVDAPKPTPPGPPSGPIRSGARRIGVGSGPSTAPAPGTAPDPVGAPGPPVTPGPSVAPGPPVVPGPRVEPGPGTAPAVDERVRELEETLGARS